MVYRFLAAALVAGLIAGLATSAVQRFTTPPLILQAETYEGGGEEAHQLSSTAWRHGFAKVIKAQVIFVDAANGNEEAWGPEDGFERIFFTSGTTVVTAFGFSLILLACMVLAREKITTRQGLLWGVAAFTASGLAPALGLSPELPGSAAAELDARQIWWFSTVAATAIGLWLALRVSTPLTIAAGIALIVVPHIVGAPHPSEFTSEVPGELSGHFAAASLVVGAIMWSLSGAIVGFMWERGERAAS